MVTTSYGHDEGPTWARWRQQRVRHGVRGRVAALRDRPAFAELFAHFAPRVKSYLMRLGVAPAQAEDLAQDALLNVWRKAHLFDPAKAFARLSRRMHDQIADVRYLPA